MLNDLPEIEFDATSLVREEVYTDQKIGSIRVLVPVNLDGTTDPTRPVSYLGQTQVMTPAGALPLNFELEVSSLADAIKAFGHAAKQSMEQTIKEIQEYQREQASKIVIPGQGKSAGIHLP